MRERSVDDDGDDYGAEMKTKSMLGRCLSVAVVVCVVTGRATEAHAQTIVAPATITATASVVQYTEHLAIFAVDGTGMLPGGLHAKSGYNTGVLIGPYNGSWADRWLRVDLGAEYSLKEMWVWNGGADNWDRAAKVVDVYYSTDSTAPAGNPWTDPKWTLLWADVTLAPAAANQAEQDAIITSFPMTGVVPMPVTARVIGLKVKSNYGDAYGAAIFELQFVVNEPSAPGTVIYVK